MNVGISKVFLAFEIINSDFRFSKIFVITVTSVRYSYCDSSLCLELSLFSRLDADLQDKRSKARLGISIIIFFSGLATLAVTCVSVCVIVMWRFVID